MEASLVVGIAKCGQVDPTLCLPTVATQLFRSQEDLFTHGLIDVSRKVMYKGGSRREYAKLVCTQLASHNVALMLRPTCSADTFVVAKSDAGWLREVWDGSLISTASVEPIAPRWLADPSALIALESSWDAPLYMSTRDGACFYDQLLLPSALIRFCGRPQVSVTELLQAGLPIEELRNYLIDGEGVKLGGREQLSPVCLTWPMGFAHSSYVAQQVMT